MKKVINIIQTLAVCYGLALGFVFLVGMLNYTDPYVIFIILPVAYLIAIYEFVYIRELHHDYTRSIALIEYDNKELSKQIENYKILDNARITRIDKLDKEITALKGELKNVVKEDKIVLFSQCNGVDISSLVFKENTRTIIHRCYYLRENKIGIHGTFQLEDNINRNFWITISNKGQIEIDLSQEYTRDKVPFSEDNDTTEQIWICPECNVEMKRFTDKIAFCDNIECTRKQWKKEKL